MVSQREHDRIYNAGRKEQVEQDIAMMKDVIDRSENYEDFRARLADELRKLDASISLE